MDKVFDKSPGERLDYVFDFSKWLSPGDTITSVTGLVDGSEAEVDQAVYDDSTATLWVAGGEEGETAHVTARVETAMGRTKDACIRIRVRDC